MIRLVLTLLLTLLPSTSRALTAFEVCVAKLSASTDLKPRQLTAVASAAQEGYSIRRLTTVIDGRRRSVTVVGESLIKTKSVAAAGARLARAYRTLAHGGGGQIGQTWFPEAFRSLRQPSTRGRAR